MKRNGGNNWATVGKLRRHTIGKLFALIILVLLSADFSQRFFHRDL